MDVDVRHLPGLAIIRSRKVGRVSLVERKRVTERGIGRVQNDGG